MVYIGISEPVEYFNCFPSNYGQPRDFLNEAAKFDQVQHHRDRQVIPAADDSTLDEAHRGVLGRTGARFSSSQKVCSIRLAVLHTFSALDSKPDIKPNDLTIFNYSN